MLDNFHLYTDVQTDQIMDQLKPMNQNVFLCRGAPSDKELKLNDQGIESGWIIDASDLVWFYNPIVGIDTPNTNLKGVQEMTILGAGNVTFDILRLLTSGVERLRKFDFP